MAKLTPDLVVLADVDGTLIKPGAAAIEEAEDFLTAVALANGVVIPVSSRPVDSLAVLFGGFTSVELVVGSGGGVLARVSTGAVTEFLHVETLSFDEGPELIDALKRLRDDSLGSLIVFDNKQGSPEVIESSVSQELSTRALGQLAGSRPFRRMKSEAFDAELPGLKPLGISLLAPTKPSLLLKLMNDLPVPVNWRSAVYPEFRLPGWTWIEVFPAVANKGDAAKRAIDMIVTDTEITPRIIAVGDSTEDAAMFNIADTSYCPRGSSPEAIAAASHFIDQPPGHLFVNAVAEQIGLTRT